MADPITVESITTTVESADQLSPEQKTFLETNAATLSDDVADKYGITKPVVVADPPAYTPPAKKEGKKVEVDPEDEEKLGAIVDQRLEGLTEQQRETAITVKVDSFITQNAGKVADISVYRDAMMKYAKHPYYQNLSAQEIFHIVAGPELMRIGAKKEREAASKAKSTQTQSSSGSRAAVVAGKKVDWNTATPEQLKAKQAEVLGRVGV